MRVFVVLPLITVLLVVLAGCMKPDHEAAIRPRAQQLIGYMCADDLDACVGLTDPLYVRGQGSDKVKIRFKLMNVLIQLGKLSTDDVRIDQITVGEDGKTAFVTTSIRVKGEWKTQNPSKWIRHEGQWYITF
jgi:hypothetical protein